MDSNERCLLRRALAAHGSRAGDVAFCELIGLYQSRIVLQILRSVEDRDAALDLWQETVIRAHKALPRLDPEANLRAWLGRIAHRLCIDHYRRRRARPEVSLDAQIDVRGEGLRSLLDILASEDPEASVQVERREARERVRQAVAELPPPYAEIVQLRVYEGLEYGEISEIASARVGALKQRMHKALALLRRRLEAEEKKRR